MSASVPTAYAFLGLAIVAEVIATTALRATEQFTRLVPSVITVLGYLVSFYCLTLVLRAIPVALTYAIWSALGMVLITVAAALVYRQIPDLNAVVGIGLIIVGVVVLGFSKMGVTH
jgi:small multidrug resistance pump